MFLFPSEDVHARNHESFPINFRTSSATIDNASHLAEEIAADSGNFPWYMTDSVAVLEDSYSEVVVNVIDLALNWQLFSDVGRPRSFVNVMSANSTLDPESRRHSSLIVKGKHELWKCPNCVHSTCVKSFGGGGGGAYSRN